MKWIFGLAIVITGCVTAVAQDQYPPKGSIPLGPFRPATPYRPVVNPLTDSEIHFSITGAKNDLTNVVVRVPVESVNLSDFGLVVYDGRSADAKLPFQVCPPRLLAKTGLKEEITLFLDTLKANETRALTFRGTSLPRPLLFPTAGESTAGQGFRWLVSSPDELNLAWHSDRKDVLLLRYMGDALDESSKDRRAETFKPYHHVFALDGETRLTKGPGGLYPHHHGLFFGFNKVTYGNGKKADVWHCTGDAYQSHEAFVQTLKGALFGRTHVRINWHGEKKEVFAEEERELTVYAPHDKGMLIEFASIVRPKANIVRLDGDPQHSGFHFRASNEVAEQFNAKKPETYFLRPDGKGKIGEERNWDPKTKKGPVNLPWDAMSFTVGGKRYTALYLDHPDNPKEARSSERVYGRIGSYFEYNLTKDKPLRVQYRIWIQEGEMTVDQCEAMCRAFTEPVSVVVK